MVLSMPWPLWAQSDDPAAELASFQVADGFEVNLFASETNGVIKPIQIRFDPQGRLWVIGSTVYPQLQPGEVPDDKVLILEDTDGDGRADKTMVFARGLMIPTGLELGHGGVYLGHGTELLFLKDTDGDGQADERRVLFRGFGTGDNHQNINSFRWSLGGELWMCQGLHTHSNVETPWGTVRLHEAGLWRFSPRRMKLEGFYGSAYEPQNPWGYVFTDFGEPLVIAGNNSSSIYPVPGLVANHRHEPPKLIWKNGQGRKSSGGEIVGTTHFPSDWQGLLILGGYINNAVWALQINDDGAGFALEDRPPLIRSSHRSFRPVDAKFGPDGALYLCDWYNPIIGHYQASFRHPDRDKMHGRIWRVTAKGRPLTPRPPLVKASAMELLGYLKSSDRWTRQQARRVLSDRPTPEVVAALERWTAHPTASGQAMEQLGDLPLVEALGLYRAHETPAPKLLERLCHAQNPNARAFAASTIGAWAEALPDPLALLAPLAADVNPRVRLHAIVAATYVPKTGAIDVVLAAFNAPSDPFIDYAFRQAVFSLKPLWLRELQTGRLQQNNTASSLAQLVRADGTPDTLSALRAQVKERAGSGAARESSLQLLAELGAPEDLSHLLDVNTFMSASRYDAAQHARILATLARGASRNVRPSGDISAQLRAVWTPGSDPALQESLLRLAAAWKSAAFSNDALRTIAAAPNKGHDNLRIAAALALAAAGGEDAQAALMDLADAKRPLAVQAAAAVGWAAIDLKRSAFVAAAVMAADDTGDTTTLMFPALLQRQGAGEALFLALSSHSPKRDAARAALRALNTGGRQAPNLASLLMRHAGLEGDAQGLSSSQQAQLIAAVRESGDSASGRAIFQRPELGCVTCHSVNGMGGNIGPDLSALGTAQPVDFILGAILEPQKEIKEGFMAVLITTKDGDEYQGYPMRESPEEFVLRDTLQNREVRLPRAAIQSRKAIGSVMPSGLAEALTRAELRDLVRYLSELGKP